MLGFMSADFFQGTSLCDCPKAELQPPYSIPGWLENRRNWQSCLRIHETKRQVDIDAFIHSNVDFAV